MFPVDIAANKLAHREINPTNESKTDTTILISDGTPLENRQKLDAVILAVDWSITDSSSEPAVSGANVSTFNASYSL